MNPSRRAYLAIDLGAETGRAMAGVLDDGRIDLCELHRFEHRPVRLPSGLHWDLLTLWRNLVEGLRRAAAWSAEHRAAWASVGVDTWGVDFALVGPSGEFYGLPHAYRDPAHEIALEKTLELAGHEKIWDITGIQCLALNTLVQLVARHAAEPALLHRAHRLLFMPDLMHFLLTGRMVNEVTIASTSQLLGAGSGGWAGGLLEALGLPRQFLGTLVPPGTLLGDVRPDVAEAAGLRTSLPVIVPACHDTACAVAAVPADPATSWCYLSSGTWSLLGAELDQPVLTAAARDAGFTNERGLGATIRFLTNMTGLWLLQECRRELAQRGQALDYTQLTEAAGREPPFRTLVNPTDESFYSPGDMPRKIAAFAQRTRQPVPESPGQLARVCFESLALSYRVALGRLEQVLDRRFDCIHVVGGGSKNPLLNQMTADATGRRVVAGPVEATALGNVLVQALGDGVIDDRQEIRRIVARSFERAVYEPRVGAGWAEAQRRFDDYVGDSEAVSARRTRRCAGGGTR